MTEPTNAGSGSEKFIEKHYVGKAMPTAIGFETENKGIKVENYIGKDLPYDMEISINNKEKVNVSDEIKIEEYKKRKTDLEREIPRLKRALETEKEEQFKEWGISKLEELKEQLKLINEYLVKNNSKEER